MNNESANEIAPPIRKVRQLWRNPISLIGLVLALVSLVFFLSFQFFELISANANPYLGIWEWLVFAPMFVVGGLLIPIGVVVTRWYWLRRGVLVSDIIRYPQIDLGNAQHRKVIIAIGAMTIIMIPLIGMASSKTVHYSSSSSFCGNGCHNVMGPEFIRYQHSAHAKVECAECHIGSGASHLIKAKINGLRQVISLVLNNYERPIPPAGVSLRPANETCEECHWSSKYFGERYFDKYSYRADEQNTRRETKMILKVGGADPQTGPVKGIHWHMAVGAEVEYAATSRDLQNIPWVRVHDAKTGQTTVFRSDGVKGNEPPAKAIMRKLDCLDCHNRGGHKVESPAHLVDVAMETGSIDKTLPYIKRETVAALVASYKSNEEAAAKIPERINAFYKEKYPDIAASKGPALNAAIEQVQSIFRDNFFVNMNVNWRSYPDGKDHKTFAGCFRCHDKKLVSADGKNLAKDCTTCHDFISSTNKDGEKVTDEFEHAILLGKGIHAEVTCRQCHTGGIEPINQCAGACHQAQVQLFSGEADIFKRFDIEADKMYGEVECDECHIPDKRLDIEKIANECRNCHEADEKDYGELVGQLKEKIAQQRKEVDDILNKVGTLLGTKSSEGPDVKAAQQWISDSNAALAALSKAGPLHNYKGAKSIYKTIVEEGQEHVDKLNTAR